MGPRCSSAETQVCHRSYIIAATKTGRHDIAEILLKVAISTKIYKYKKMYIQIYYTTEIVPYVYAHLLTSKRSYIEWKCIRLIPIHIHITAEWMIIEQWILSRFHMTCI
jgi:hypothetical protein